MNRPTWMILVGVLAIIFGFRGMVGNLLSIVSSVCLVIEPEMEIMSEHSDDQAPGDGSAPNMNEETQYDEKAQKKKPSQRNKTLEKPIQLLAETTSWAVAIGGISLLVSGAYLIAGIFLMTKSFGIRVFYWAIAASVLWSVVQTVLYSQAQISMLMAAAPVFAPSIVIDLMLATVVLVGTNLQPPTQTTTKDSELCVDALAIISKSMKWGVPTITGFFAALCVVVFPFWIMGIPGVNNEYARGWTMGLHVIIGYPIAWIIVVVVARLLKKVVAVGQQRSLDVGVSVCLLICLGLAFLRLVQAFGLIFA